MVNKAENQGEYCMENAGLCSVMQIAWGGRQSNG